MTMLYITGGALLVAAVAGYIVYQQRKRIGRLRHVISSLETTVKRQAKIIAKRNKAIEAMEAASDEARKAHEAIRTGSARDQFDSSLDVLSNDPSH